MANCIYCYERAGLFGQICRNCRKLLDCVRELRGKVSFGEFLDGLERTGVPKNKIAMFLHADPDGKGCMQDQIAAEMTTELMNVMGISGQQTAKEVKRIRGKINEESD